ncbi:MAG: hypothetical protein LUH10_16955 [Tannerellaceae bacterium]|nr:hypothetical protein [Tannerellaceae bacterium]
MVLINTPFRLKFWDKLVLSIVLLTALFTSCQAGDPDVLNPDGNKSNSFLLSYYVEGIVSPLTKSSVPVEDGEDVINSLYILFFENTSGGTGRFIDAIDMEASGMRSSGRLNVVFPEDSELSHGEEYKLILLANTETYTGIAGLQDMKTACAGKTENEVIHTLLRISGVEPSVSEQTNNSNLMEMDNLPMSAVVIKKAWENNLSVELIRAVSRFDVVCEAPGYTLASASVWNGMTTTTLVETVFNDFQNAPRTERYYGVSAQNNQIVGSLYAFENYVANPEQNDKLTTCLIVGLLNQVTSRIEYFRTNINVSQYIGHQIKRNNVYRTTIMGVASKGPDNERDAYEGKGNLLYYLELNPAVVPNVPAAGGSTEVISVHASGPWTAKLERHGFFGNAGFNGNTSRTEITGTGNDNFTVTFEALTQGSVYPRMDITVTLDDIEEEVTKTLTIYQDPLSEGLIIWSNTDKEGVLTKTTGTNYTSYVYNLGENIRNEELFGPGGKVSVPGGYKFQHDTGFDDKYNFGQGSIFQAMNAPTLDEYRRLQALMELYDTKLLMITNKSTGSEQLTGSLSRYNQIFQPATNYTATSIGLSASVQRYFNTRIEHPLIDYLLETGPFTDTRIDPDKILLQGYNATNAGLTQWNDTFIPIIMAVKSNKEYCVFGIDPVERLIIMTDPSIFGSQNRTYNKNNFIESKPENIAFLNNFIAWMTNAALYGDEFLDKHR